MEKQTNPTDSNHFIISILIRQNGYCFLVSHSSTKKIVKFGELSIQQNDHSELLQKIKEEVIHNLKSAYANSVLKIFYQNSFFALVPSEIYETKHASDYLKFNTKLFPSDSISCEKNEVFKISIPFIPLVHVHNELLNHFESLDFYTSVNTALKVSFNFCKNQQGEHAFSFIQQNTFILVLLKNEKLQVANFFEFNTAEDFAYYCLFVIEQFKFNRENMHFSFVGRIDKESRIYKYMENYIRNLVIISISELQIATKPSVDEDQFLNENPILALQLCESYLEN